MTQREISQHCETILAQLREGNLGAGGYVTGLVDALLRNVLSQTADPVATMRIAKRVKAFWPAYKEGVIKRAIGETRQEK